MSKPLNCRDLQSPMSSCCYIHPIKPQRFSWAPNTRITESCMPRVYSVEHDSQLGIVLAEQVLRTSLGLWNFLKRDPTPTSLK